VFKILIMPVICSCAFVVAACNAWAGTTKSGSPTALAGGVPKGYKLVWSDEFDKPGLPDAAKWGYDTGRNSAGWNNNELQYYTAQRLENARVENGQLIITARKERLTNASDYGGQSYTSARLLTRGKAAWTYGFFEVRAMLPCGLGTWPAIWTLGTGGSWPDDGELDIMEQVGSNPGRIFGTTHTKLSGGIGIGGDTNLPNACTAFHNYQMTWTADHIMFGIDDINYFEFKKNNNTPYSAWPFDKPQYMILNLAIGGNLGGPVDDNIFPVSMKIEHVRVYQ
jgi:beta-glucanase (GH16 family)